VALQTVPLQFTRLEGHGTPEATKRAAVSLYGYGLSFNAVAELLGTTAQSVLRWVCGYVDESIKIRPYIAAATRAGWIT
jgi:transposase-like protein